LYEFLWLFIVGYTLLHDSYGFPLVFMTLYPES
jgi:hypothetical protein